MTEMKNGVPENMQVLLEQMAPIAEAFQQLRLRRDPVTDPDLILIDENEEDEAVTDLGIGIRFRIVTEGERRTYKAWAAGKPFIDWPTEDQVRLLNENLITPDFKAKAGGELTEEFCLRRFDWKTFIDLGTTLVKESRADFRVPRITSEKKDPGRRTGSKARSSTRSSTKKVTRTKGNGVSTG